MFCQVHAGGNLPPREHEFSELFRGGRYCIELSAGEWDRACFHSGKRNNSLTSVKSSLSQLLPLKCVKALSTLTGLARIFFFRWHRGTFDPRQIVSRGGCLNDT